MIFDDLQKNYQYVQSLYSPHTKIVKYVPPNTIVLDIGCNWGYMAKELKQKNCTIFGIEIDKKAAQKARQWCKEVTVADVENIEDFPFSEGYFDIIIFSDILEHLERPDVVLNNFKRYLKPTGLVITSIPNIARLEYRVKHLFGKFDYEPQGGLLSCTHLRHFTLKTAKKLFEESGYEIMKIDYTGLASKLFNLLPKLLAFQFLIMAVPKKE